MSSSERLPVLDGLRAISILLVLAAHMLPLGPKPLQLNFTAGAMGMSLFFSLSGFLITSTLLHNANLIEFVAKRLARILPLAYAYTLFVFTFVYFDPTAAFWTATFLLNYFTVYMVDGLNNHFWSLCVEMQFYAAIALIVLFGGKKGVWFVWPACLIVTAVRVYAGAYIAIQTHLRVDEILTGACVATLYQDWWKTRVRAPAVYTGLAAVLWLLSSNPYTEGLQYLRPYATALFLAATLCHKKTSFSEILESRPLRYIAAVSYALYVMHPLTIHGWFNAGGVLDRYLLKRPISFVITFAAAHISTFYWERYWLNATRKWIQARRSRLIKSTA